MISFLVPATFTVCVWNLFPVPTVAVWHIFIAVFYFFSSIWVCVDCALVISSLPRFTALSISHQCRKRWVSSHLRVRMTIRWSVSSAADRQCCISIVSANCSASKHKSHQWRWLCKCTFHSHIAVNLHPFSFSFFLCRCRLPTFFRFRQFASNAAVAAGLSIIGQSRRQNACCSLIYCVHCVCSVYPRWYERRRRRRRWECNAETVSQANLANDSVSHSWPPPHSFCLSVRCNGSIVNWWAIEFLPLPILSVDQLD